MVVMNRHPAIDWLRVIATFAVFVFHSGAPYAAGDWHISHYPKSATITIANAWLLLWSIPLLFALSGMSMHLALRTRDARTFLKDRARRLLAPLIIGILVIAPPQVYFERLGRGQFHGAFIEFYPHYFNAPYLAIGGAGNFAWMGLHLWYILFLLVLTIALLPMLIWLNSDAAQPLVDAAAHALERPGVVLLAGAPIALIELAFGNVGLGGWNMLAYPLFLVFGYLVVRLPNGILALRRIVWPALLLALTASVALLALTYRASLAPYGLYASPVQTLLHAFSGWWWVVGLIGLGYRYLQTDGPMLRRLSEMALPFYILHQTFIVAFSYYLNPLAIATAWKYLAVIVLSLIAIVAAYAVVIRPIAPMRVLFGLRAKP